jgi:hypothetical protein
LLQGEQDEVEAYEKNSDHETSPDEDERYDEEFEQYVDDEDKQEFIFDDDEEEVHKVNAVQDVKQPTGICYNLAYKGKCDTPGCVYNHDPAAIKKFQENKKPTGTAIKLNKPSTPFRKSPPRDSKRRA